MRADRLVASLLVLQARGRVSAAQLAAELEVSVRTARRDLEALAMAGVPVYSTSGRHGGWSLLGGGRIDLTGLTASEARALFLVASPRALRSPAARAALRKVVRALPTAFRSEAEAAADAVVLDPGGWGNRAAAAVAHLDTLERAVVDRVQVVLGYLDRHGAASERTVHPLGLVEKGRSWYLVADTGAGRRTFRLSRIRAVTVTEAPATRPEGFDLETAWRDVAETVEQRRTAVRAVALVAPGLITGLRAQLGDDLAVTGTAPDGRAEIEVAGVTSEVIADELAGYGADIEVVAPPAVRAHLARLGRELIDRYGQPDPPADEPVADP
jgi:predicted DNA-binding transcriptional regulator YafY